MKLYDYFKKVCKEGWDLRHIELQINKISATIVKPKVELWYETLHFVNDISHIIIPNYENFHVNDYALFSDTIDSKSINIHDGNVHVHIELRKHS